MRRSSITYRTLPVLTVLAALALPGCAAPAGAGNGTAARSGAPAPPSTAAGSPGCAYEVPDQSVVLTERDSGREVCLRAGTRLEIYLHGTASDRWSTPVADGPALGPGVSGKGTLMIGVTAGFFVADRPGLAHVTAARSTEHFALTVLVSS